MRPIDEWKLEGRQEGILLGMQQGVQEGAQQKTVRVVKAMLKLGMDATTIAAVAEQSPEQISQLIAEIQTGTV